MMDIVRSQVIEMIALQACSHYMAGRSIKWVDMGVKPTFEEDWFWNHFEDMVDQAVMGLCGAVEGWVTVEYEEDIADIIEAHAGKTTM